MNWLNKLNITLIIAILLSACADRSPTSASTMDSHSGIAIKEESSQYLEIATVSLQGSELGIVLPGRVAFRPQAMASIGSPVSARVVQVSVRPGEFVKAGTPLVTLQSAEAANARAAFDQASARVSAAEDILRRQTQMVEKGVGLEVERFSAEIFVREARAELERAKKEVSLIGIDAGDRFVVKAPNSGVVLTVRANVGAFVVPGGEALVEVGDPNRLWVIADIPESDVGSAAVGRLAQVKIPSVNNTFDAVVDGVGQMIDGDQRRLPVYLNATGATHALTPGMLAEVRFMGENDNIMTLPVTAVLIKNGSERVVYVEYEAGRFAPRSVRTGMSREGRVTILEGLNPSDRVVVKGALLLDGAAEQLL